MTDTKKKVTITDLLKNASIEELQALKRNAEDILSEHEVEQLQKPKKKIQIKDFMDERVKVFENKDLYKNDSGKTMYAVFSRNAGHTTKQNGREIMNYFSFKKDKEMLDDFMTKKLGDRISVRCNGDTLAIKFLYFEIEE